MNENPGETPNPLNPTPAAGQVPAQPSAPVPTPTQSVDSLAPAERPMEKAAPAPAAPAKKKKTGLIAGIVAVVAVLIIGGIAAAIAVIMNQPDPVTLAMNKIMNGDAPANVAIDGNINIEMNDEYSPISKLNIDLKSSVTPSSTINNSKAVVTVEIRNVGELSAEFDEVYAGNGDLYFKIDGVADALEQSGILYLLNLSNNIEDCAGDESCVSEELSVAGCDDDANADCMSDGYYVLEEGGQDMLDEETLSYFASLLDVVEVVDGEWLKVSVDQLNMISDGITNDSDISCITNLVSDVNTNSNSAIELYRKNPFIVTTNKDVALNSKNYPVYKVSIDSEKFANYVNSIQNADLSSKLYACLDWDNNVQISADDVAEIVSTMPTVYAEVDNENNFSRLYLVSELNDGEGTMTIDLGFSYPDFVNVSEPEEYKDFSEVLQEIMSSMFTIDTDIDIYEEL